MNQLASRCTHTQTHTLVACLSETALNRVCATVAVCSSERLVCRHVAKTVSPWSLNLGARLRWQFCGALAVLSRLVSDADTHEAKSARRRWLLKHTSLANEFYYLTNVLDIKYNKVLYNLAAPLLRKCYEGASRRSERHALRTRI